MLNRWFKYYESSSAMVRLITLTVIIWSIYAYLHSNFGIDQPIWQWMTICVILFISNILKVTLVSKQKRKDEYRVKSTLVRVLILPLTAVVFITMFVLLYHVGKMRRDSVVLSEERRIRVGVTHPQLPESQVRVMVLIVSASREKRRVFRETTLKLMPKNNEHISYFYQFIVGQDQDIKEEMNVYGDILVLNCSDLPQDASKKVYSAFEWADRYDFDYLIKADDDVFVRWDTVSKELELAGRVQRYWRGLAYW